MKLKAPEGVGDPCVAGVVLAPRDGCYEVEPDIAGILIECFGFVPAVDDTNTVAASAQIRRRNLSRTAARAIERSTG